MRRLEIRLEELRNKHACGLAELGRKADALNQLRLEADGLRDLLHKAEQISLAKTDEAHELRRLASQQGSDLVDTIDALEAVRRQLAEEQTTFANFRARIVSYQFLNGLFVGWSEGPISNAYRLSELHYVVWRRNRNPAVAQRLDAPGSLPLLSVDMAGGALERGQASACGRRAGAEAGGDRAGAASRPQRSRHIAAFQRRLDVSAGPM